MKNILKLMGLMFLTLILLNSCKDDGEFDNKAYVVTPNVETIINKANSTNDTRQIKVGIAKPEAQALEFRVALDASLVTTYETIYGEETELLAEDFYKINQSKIVVNQGAVLSEESTISFTNISDLDRDKIYVLPIRVSSSNLDVLSTKNIVYYVIKGGAVINVVANMNENFAGFPSLKSPDALRGLSDFTMEALIYPRELNKLISTVMGVEGYFLLRIGDAGVPPNQLQIATSGGNRVIGTNIPLNQWTHMSVVYKKDDRTLKVYYNGEEVYNQSNVNYNVLSFARDDFYIGKSWDNNRSFNGEFSEFRVWNIARTQEEIKATPYEVPNDSPGLVGYWKFNEGSGNTIKDHTQNGNDMIADKGIKWVPVELPLKAK